MEYATESHLFLDQRTNPYADVELMYNPLHVHELTGLPNRIALYEAMYNAIECIPGHFAVIAMDLDGLKSVNDENGGHAAGDKYLQYAAHALQDCVRDTDAVTIHVSGDEFVVVLPGIDTRHTLNRVITRIQIELDDLGVPCSMGGEIHAYEQTAQNLLKAADRELYRDKILRKFNKYNPRQRAVALEIGAAARKAQINLHDIPTLLAAITLLSRETI